MWFSRLTDTIANYLFTFSVPMDKRIDFLGLMYSASPESVSDVNEAFMDDFRSRIWLSYRRNLTESLVDKNGHSVGIHSDAGWGCSIRATQMLLAQCLIGALLGRQWRRSSGEKIPIFEEILSLFFDTTAAPLSLHRMVAIGDLKFGKQPSDWFGPTTGSRAISLLFNESEFSKKFQISTITFDSGEIITSKIPPWEKTDGLIVLLSHRLGLDCFNSERYKSTLLKLFGHAFFQGISSGESVASAYYFFAACHEYLYYLDPHTVQEPLTALEDLTNPARVLKMQWNRLNPSLCLGFMVKNPMEFQLLCDTLQRIDPDLFEVRENSMHFNATTVDDASFEVIN